MIDKILKLATAFEKLAMDKTLYHGTSVRNAKEILERGLIPQVGGWVESSYGMHTDLDPESEDYEGLSEDQRPKFEIAFATDKDTISSAVGGMRASVARELGKKFHEVSFEDISHHGAIVVMKQAYNPHEESDNDTWRKKPDDDPEGNWDVDNPGYVTVEPGDYFSEEGAGIDYVLSGKPLLRFLRRYYDIEKDVGTFKSSPQ